MEVLTGAAADAGSIPAASTFPQTGRFLRRRRDRLLDAEGARSERKDFMASSKRQTTMAKMARERKLQERREKKQEKKQAARDAKAAEGSLPAREADDERDDGE